MSEFIESSNLMFLELDKHLETLISAFKGGPNLGSSSNSGKMTPETVGFVLLFFTKSEMWLVWGTLLVNLWVYSLSQFRQVKLCRIKSSVGEKYPGCLVVKEKGDKLKSGSVGKKHPRCLIAFGELSKPGASCHSQMGGVLLFRNQSPKSKIGHKLKGAEDKEAFF